MALADPLTLTINAVPYTLPRVSTGENASRYATGDGLIEYLLGSSYGKRTRRTLRVNHAKITADPFLPSQNVKVSTSMYLVFDIPPAGYNNTELSQIFAGFNALYTASGSAHVLKLLGGES